MLIGLLCGILTAQAAPTTEGRVTAVMPYGVNIGLRGEMRMAVLERERVVVSVGGQLAGYHGTTRRRGLLVGPTLGVARHGDRMLMGADLISLFGVESEAETLTVDLAIAGSYTSIRNTSTVHGAMESAYDTVRVLLETP